MCTAARDATLTTLMGWGDVTDRLCSGACSCVLACMFSHASRVLWYISTIGAAKGEGD